MRCPFLWMGLRNLLVSGIIPNQQDLSCFISINSSCYLQNFEMEDAAFYEKNRAFPLILMFSVINRG